jgi:DASS family divalent anion:Na+ symporter
MESSIRLADTLRPSSLPAPASAHLRRRHLYLHRLPRTSSSSSSLFFSPSHHHRLCPTPRHDLLQPLAAAASGAAKLVPASPAPADSSPEPKPSGAKLVPLVISLAVGLAVRFLAPRPAEVSPRAWQLLSIFLSTIAGLVLGPLPVGAWAFLGLTAAVATHTLPFAAAFAAFTNEIIWLIVISFFFARGFVKTGLGDRVATYFVKWLGKSTLGLSYGLALGEACIAPAMPSTAARAGGIFLPIIKSLSLSAGSKPNHPSSRKLGTYLVMSQFQVT